MSHEHRILNGQRFSNRSNSSCETTGVTGIGFAPNCLIQQDSSSVQELLGTGKEEKLRDFFDGFKHGSVLTV